MPSEKNNRIHAIFLVVKYSTYGCVMLLNLYLTYHNHHWQGVILERKSLFMLYKIGYCNQRPIRPNRTGTDYVF